MRNYECIKVAFWNIKASRHLSVKVIIGLATVSMMLFCLFVYKSVFQQQILNMDEQYKTNCYLEKNIYSDSWDEYEREVGEATEQKDAIAYTEHSILTSLSMLSEDTDEEVGMQIGHASIEAGGSEYIGRSDILSGIRPEKKFWSTDVIMIGLWENDYCVFPTVARETFQSEDRSYLIGRLPEHEREVIISDYILGEFGIDEKEQKTLIGKPITLYLQDKEYTAFEHYTLSGIFRASILETREKNNFADNMQQIYINLDQETKKSYGIRGGVIRYYAADYDHLLECSERAKKVDDEITLSLYGGIYEIISKQIMAIFDIFSFIILGFVFAITVYLFCILYFFFQSNQSFMFVLRAIGMKESKLYRIVFAELSLFCLISVAIGFYIGMFVLYGLKSIYDYGMPLKFEFDSRILLFSAIAAFLYCFFVSICFGGGYCMRQQKKNIVEGIKKFNLGILR